MTDDQYKDFVVEHEQMLKALIRLSEDHEKRLRMLERVMFGALAVISFVEFLRKGL